MQKFLVLGDMPTNARPETHLAAGPWCFCGKERLFPDWEKNFVFGPEPLAHSDKLRHAARQAQVLCVAVIPEIARTLLPRAEKFPPIYWQMILAPWAIALSSQIVERWLRIQAMKTVWANENLQVELLPNEIPRHFSDENDFYLSGSLGNAFNHWLFSRLLEIDFPKNWQKNILQQIPCDNSGAQSQKKSGFKNFLKKCSLGLPFPPLKGVSIPQSLLFSLGLLHSCKTLPHEKPLTKIFEDRGELADLPDLTTLLPIFLAGLPESVLRLQHKPLTKNANNSFLKIASVVSYEDSGYRQKLARWKAGGGKIGYVQHGGNYGQIKVSCNAALAEYSQDIFFTWGWQKHGAEYGNFRPMPYPQLAALANRWQKANDDILFVGTEMACHAYRLESRPTPLQFLQYRRDKAIFLKNCHPAIRKNILYRPYFKLPGLLEDGAWLASRFPEIKICEGNLAQHLLHCKALVIDHPGTTMLEALAANAPVILYWNPGHWNLTDEARELLELLKEAGIWHSSPRDAAQKLESIWHDSQGWQESEAVQKARRNYCYHQARTQKNGTTFYWLKTLWHL